MLAIVLVCSLAMPSSDRIVPNDPAVVAAPVSAYYVARTYEDLLAKPEDERVRTLLALPSSIQTAIWRHRYLTALARHPEYTDEQRAVIQEAIAILTPDFFDIDRNSPQSTILIDQPLRRLKQRAKAAFGAAAAKDLFTRLTPELDSSRADDFGAEPNENRRHPLKPIGNAGVVIPVMTCGCSMEDDWCDSFGSGLGIYVCRGVPCWPTQKGCGWFMRVNCDGLCGYRQPM